MRRRRAGEVKQRAQVPTTIREIQTNPESPRQKPSSQHTPPHQYDLIWTRFSEVFKLSPAVRKAQEIRQCQTKCHSFSQRRWEKLSSQRDTQIILDLWGVHGFWLSQARPTVYSHHHVAACWSFSPLQALPEGSVTAINQQTCSWRSFLNSSRVPASPR